MEEEKIIKYNSKYINGNIIEGKTRLGICNACGKQVEFKYEVTCPYDPYWFAECECGHLTIDWILDI